MVAYKKMRWRRKLGPGRGAIEGSELEFKFVARKQRQAGEPKLRIPRDRLENVQVVSP